jgi:hypothetical protein
MKIFHLDTFRNIRHVQAEKQSSCNAMEALCGAMNASKIGGKE